MLHDLAMRLRSLFRRRLVEAEMDDELRFHLERQTEKYVAAGVSRVEAERLARIELGGLAQARENCRDARGVSFAETLLQDLGLGIRLLRKSPGFTAVAVLTLALGIGANTAIFALVRTTLFHALPARASNRLVVIWINNLGHGWARIGPSGQDYLDWREQSTSFEDLFLFEHGSGTVTGNGEPEQVAGLRVTTNFGEFLGVKPLVGRTFRVEEGSARHNYAVLACRYWQRRYASDPNVVGRGMTLNGEAYTIIRVLPPELNRLWTVDVVVPFDNEWLKKADSDLGVFGRLKRGVTVEQASSEMKLVAERIANARPSRRGFGTVLVPLESVRVEYIRPAMLLLLGAAAFVLLIACANVANLMLARADARQREVAVRMALGAGRLRLVRQFLAESALLGLLGGAAGIVLAEWSTYLFARFVPSSIPVPNAADRVFLPEVHVDTAALVFAVLASLMAAILFGMAPALQSLRCHPNDSLKEGGRGFLSGIRGNRTRSALVIAESALAFILVIGAGLMLRSFSNLLGASPGFRPDQLLTMRVKLPNDAKDSPYREPRQRAAAFQRFLSNVEAVPGVESAAFTEIVPLSQDDMDMGYFVIKEEPALPLGEHLSADYRDVTPQYFGTMGIPLLRGRAFTEHDTPDNPRVVIIDEALARRFFAGKDPVGMHLQVPEAGRPDREIVGVVGAVHDIGMGQQPRPTIYFPYQQSPDQTMSLVVRTAVPPEAILPAIKNAIWAADPNQPIFNVRSMDEIVAGVTSAHRIALLALGAFAFLALALAGIGIYGVTSYVVSQKTQEIGIRRALGAQPGDVMEFVVSHGVRLALAGVAAGLAASFALTRLMSALLFGVSSTDPLTFGGVAVLLTGVALAACYVPARRAARVDPMVALRYE